MNLKRLIRDGAILLLVCGAFYATTYVGGEVTEEVAETEVESNDFTPIRMEADALTRLSKWEGAAEAYKKLIEQDPYNGYAQFRLGASYYNLRLNAVRKLRDRTQLSEEEITFNEDQKSQFEDLAIEQLEKSREFLRYRRDSSFCLAVIYADQNELDKSLARLRDFVNEGGWRFEGLENIEVFGVGGPEMQRPWAWVTSKVKLHRFEEFWVLVERSNKTRNRMATPAPVRPALGNRRQ